VHQDVDIVGVLFTVKVAAIVHQDIMNILETRKNVNFVGVLHTAQGVIIALPVINIIVTARVITNADGVVRKT